MSSTTTPAPGTPGRPGRPGTPGHTNTSSRVHEPDLVRLLIDAREAAALIGISPSTWAKWDRMGLCPSRVPIPSAARTPRWDPHELRAWLKHGCPDRERWNELMHKGDATW